ncbi:glycosyltransferase family 2 protein [Psychromonas ossibalaenae]|uniref:glycosyltransferase family 2 protein n=1 Tax=Psychromonas ossibalaenae TaxID=444922 RepID=UPI00037FDB7D|nr:glycosyltransferase family 2 protein [Psychromonas ossibalaenae]
MTAFNPCFLIPCYNHGQALTAVVKALSADYDYPIFIVDDGSDLVTKEVIGRLSDIATVVTLIENQGKGGAVIAGIKTASKLGFSHALQIDADGQHDLSALAVLLNESQAHPDALISGRPVYDQSVPKGRLYGRYITHFWVWIETLSFSVKDSMCGFRSYPLTQSMDIIRQEKIGLRMDFDTEIMVKLFWNDVDVRFIKTRVIYPENGISHFDAFRDNVKISKMHTCLFFGMLKRLPKLLTRSKRMALKNKHWSKQEEQGTYYGMKILLSIYSLFGRTAFSMLLKVVMAYYMLTAKESRFSSAQYLDNLRRYASKTGQTLPGKLSVYRHLNSFGQTMLDKLAAWKGDFSTDNLTVHGIEHIEPLAKSDRGIVIIGSHLGNLELCRALSEQYVDLKINALVFTEHAPRFNAMIKAVNPKADLNIIQVNKLGPETAILLDDKIEQGEWVVIVGDRTSTSVEQRSIWADFLGKPAPFPQGPFLLASILKAPVYLLFGLRNEYKKEAHFDVYFEPFSEQIKLPRGRREQALLEVVDLYARRLEHYTMQAPLQWYNFFNFWQLSGKKNDK